MEKVEILEIQNYDGTSVLFDVFPWLVAIKETKDIVINGPFRVGMCLNEFFWPAVLIRVDEHTNFEEELEALSEFLGKKIEVLTPLKLSNHLLKTWITLSTDYYCPLLPHLPSHIKKLAILQDVMSADGVFGPENAKNFIKMVHIADALLCTSLTTEKRYRHLEATHPAYAQMPPKRLIPFRLCHQLKTPLDEVELFKINRDPNAALSLHSIFRRKNIFRTVEIAGYYLSLLTHFGRFYSSDYSKEEKEKWLNLVKTKQVKWKSSSKDEEVIASMLTSTYFICSSENEGFSVPPMEAILLGVPVILLSDIPVHREIYGDFNVNFFSTKIGSLDFPTKPKKITPEDRLEIFNRHSIQNMIRPLLCYLNEKQ